MSQLSNPEFLSLINGLTKATKELIDNSVETTTTRQDFAKFVSATPTTEQDEKFVSTVSLWSPAKTPEGQNVAKANSAKWHETIIGMLDKTTYSSIYSYEFFKGRMDATQKIEQEFVTNTRRHMNSMRQEMNREAYKILNLGFSAASPYLSPDLEAVFSANHTFSDSSSATFSNLLAAQAPSLEVLREVEKRLWAFTDAEWLQMPLAKTKKIICKMWGSAAHFWKQIFFGQNYRTATLTGNNWVNIYNNGEYEVVESAYITSDTAYYFQTDYSEWLIDNPCYLWVIDFPTIYWEETNVNNMTTTVSYVSYYKVGMKNIPIGLYGSLWA